METMDINLFSYGPLQQESVQLSSFGRLLQGALDALVEFRRELGNVSRNCIDVIQMARAGS